MMISTPFIEVHMNIQHIKETLSKILEPHRLGIYSVKTKKEFGRKILEILIDVESMDINQLEIIHLKLVEQMDENALDDDYYLELSSLGIERPLSNPDEIKNAIHRYIYLESKLYKGYGTLTDYQNDIVFVTVNQKGRIKTIEIQYHEIKNMRTAVKI